ncbi:serine/threonine protein kinase, CMGC, CDC2/CDK subfamily [Orbilia brochopaga]|uniref:Serine/threonine protein kinase, CMGC, CDC2/CDK subfamily n=2 Tax=Orbilia brochopaga TaxID=3140254 RepID=A0AAV9UUY5_9PEZI
MSQKRRAPDSPVAERPTPAKRPSIQDPRHPGVHRFRGCSHISSYRLISKLGEGTFGLVTKAQDTRNNQLVALKQFTVTNEKEGFPITALREIKYLKQLRHPNVIPLLEMVVEKPTRGKDGQKRGTIMMVTPYMHHDLSGLLENPSVQFTERQIKCYLLQLLKGIQYLHKNNILHRDIKAANLLINNKGILQIADFGLARRFDEPPPKPGSGGGVAYRQYTGNVVTRWYRAPELCLGERNYTTSVDIWGVGCVFAEMKKGRPILPGNTDTHQIELIFQLCGPPNERSMPGWEKLPDARLVKGFVNCQRTLEAQFNVLGSSGVALLSDLLKLDPRTRVNAMDALDHEYFRVEPLPAKPSELPAFEDSHELDRRKRAGQKPLPPAPAGGTVGVGPSADWSGHMGEPPPYHMNGNGRHVRPPPPPPDRRPAWMKETRDVRAPPPMDGGMRGPDHRRGVIKGDKDKTDTYIPSYRDGGRPPPRDDSRDWRDDRRHERPRDDVRGGRPIGGPGGDRNRERDPRDRERDREQRERDRERERAREWRR